MPSLQETQTLILQRDIDNGLVDPQRYGESAIAYRKRIAAQYQLPPGTELPPLSQ